MWRPGFRSVLARRPWHEAIHMPGSSQVQHARALLLSRPYLTRIPDQWLVLSDVGSGTHHVQATRDEQGAAGSLEELEQWRVVKRARGRL